MEEKYKVDVWCDNCRLQQELEINVGITVDSVLNYKYQTHKCKKCGCYTLNKIKYN